MGESEKPTNFEVDASPVSWKFKTSQPEVTVIPADAVEVTPSPTPRFLRLRVSDFSCYSHVWLRVDGEWHDITLESLPDEAD